MKSYLRRLFAAVDKSSFNKSIKKLLQKVGLYIPVSNLRFVVLLRHHWMQEPFRNMPNVLRFLFFNKETTNFIFDISNKDELIEFISKNLNVELDRVRRYAEELENDAELRSSLEEKLRGRKDRNKRVYYGRRMGWYCLVRIKKPALVVETGTNDGLGSSVLARALYRNMQEGHPGSLFTFDIDPSVGWLLNPALGSSFQIMVESTRTGLERYLTGRNVDIFLHDSEHSYEHEMFEFETVSRFLSKGAIVLSDNSHACDAMKDFCEKRGLKFVFFKEQSKEHIYPGAGIGFSIWQ